MKGLFSVLWLVVFVYLSGCSSSDSGGGTTAAVNYDGMKTAVEITDANAKTTVTDTLKNSTTSGDASGKGFTKASSAISFSKPIARLKADIQSKITSRESIGGTTNGTCGGSLVSSGDLNPAGDSFSFSVNATFTDFCDTDNTTLNGSVSMSGSINSTTFVMTYNAAFTNFTAVVDAGTESYTIDGSTSGVFGLNFLESSTISTLSNISVKDNISGVTYFMENHKLEITTDASGGLFSATTDTTYSGRFYQSDKGYIDITTVTPFHRTSNATYPESGSAKFTGSNGAVVTLTATDSSQYSLETDTNGDGTAESTETGAWSDLGVGLFTSSL